MRSNTSFTPLIFSAAALALMVWVVVKSDQAAHVYAPLPAGVHAMSDAGAGSPTLGGG
jgi:hypothetical protein